MIAIGLYIAVYTFVYTNWKYSSSGFNGFTLTALLVGYGFYRLIRTYPETCIFNKVLDQFILKQRSVLQTQVTKGWLSEILDVRVEKKPGKNRNAYYNVFLVTKWHRRLPLTVTNIGDLQVANQIRLFLNLPSKL